MNIPTVTLLLKRYRISPKKHLGQHFLSKTPIIEKIINALGVRHTDDVVEIGAGLGIISAMIAQSARNVFAIEKDRTFFPIYEKEFGHLKNIRFLCMDFLKLDFKKDLEGASYPLKIIGNIPYNISTPVVFKLLENKALISYAVLTVQQEVARRILARPNTKDYGILSVMIQSQIRTVKLFDIKPTSFIPPPGVVSSVIRLDFETPSEFQIKNIMLFSKLVKTAFGQRRKTIKNSLSNIKSPKIPTQLINRALIDLKIDPQRRAETILISEYAALADYLEHKLASCL